MSFFQKKTLSFYCGIVGALLGLIGACVYFVYSNSVEHFNSVIFSVMLVGGLSCALLIFTKWDFASLVPCALFAAAFGLYVNDRVIMFEEMINQIYGMNERGAILEMVLLVFALILLAFIVVTIASFSDSAKQKNLKTIKRKKSKKH